MQGCEWYKEANRWPSSEPSIKWMKGCTRVTGALTPTENQVTGGGTCTNDVIGYTWLTWTVSMKVGLLIWMETEGLLIQNGRRASSPLCERTDGHCTFARLPAVSKPLRCNILFSRLNTSHLHNIQYMGMDYISCFLARSQNCEKRLLASSCLSVRMEQLGYHRKDYHETGYLCIFRKSVTKIQLSLKPDRENGYFTWRPIYTDDHISLSSS